MSTRVKMLLGSSKKMVLFFDRCSYRSFSCRVLIGIFHPFINCYFLRCTAYCIFNNRVNVTHNYFVLFIKPADSCLLPPVTHASFNIFVLIAYCLHTNFQLSSGFARSQNGTVTPCKTTNRHDCLNIQFRNRMWAYQG